MNKTLKELYESTAEEFLFGICMLQLPRCTPAPYIHIHYPDWSREKLDVVRETFRGGITLVSSRRPTGHHDMHLTTRETVTIQCPDESDTSVLRGPAWSAHLSAIEHEELTAFESQRGGFDGYLLLLQTPQWEFLTGIDDRNDWVYRRRRDTPTSRDAAPVGPPSSPLIWPLQNHLEVLRRAITKMKR